MRIAFVTENFNIGGAETFLLSLIPFLMNLKHDVYLIVKGSLVHNFFQEEIGDKNINLIFEKDLKNSNDCIAMDCLFITNPETIFFASKIIKQKKITSRKIIAPVFQTKMFCLGRGFFDFHNNLTVKIFKNSFPAKNVIFVNESSKVEHLKKNSKLNNSIIIPLIVNGEKFSRRGTFKKEDIFRIVSVGRLDHFKTYNLTMIDVIKRLKKSEINVHWDIYGDGPMRGAMMSLIEKERLEADITLKGSIEYVKLPEIFNKAFVFVGSGIGMMEAASCGVPTIPAIEYSDKADSFGIVSEISGNSFFEPSREKTRYDIGDLIRVVCYKNSDEYEKIGDDCRLRMSEFFPGSIAEKYVDAINQAEENKLYISNIDYFLYIISSRIFKYGKGILKKWIYK